ncbi:MAG: ADP-ribosylglycohydrolase family protein [Myxococcales bacterium]|nr:ADP-ribosylglycohydrolase family protein [Myxococcales bacterium]
MSDERAGGGSGEQLELSASGGGNPPVKVIEGDVRVSASARVEGEARVGGAARVEGDVRVEGEAVVGADLLVEGDLSVDGDLRLAGDLLADGDVELDGDLTVKGDILSDGDIASDGDLTVRGDIALDGDIDIDGDVRFGGDARVAGSITSDGDLRVAGNLVIDGDLIVDGTLTAASTVGGGGEVEGVAAAGTGSGGVGSGTSGGGGGATAARPVVSARAPEVAAPSVEGDGYSDSEAALAASAATAATAALTPRSARNVGAVLGAAIGDAMGHPTEFIESFEELREKFAPSGVTGYALYWERDGARFAPYTDDTQMAEIVLQSLLDSRAADEHLGSSMQRIANGFISWMEEPQGGHRAPGNACLAGVQALADGAHWSEAGGAKAGGCGSVMRAYPFGLVFADDIARAERWSVAHSKLTHRDPIALAACAAMAVGVAHVAAGRAPRYALSEMVGAACRYSPSTAVMMAQAIDDADSGVGPEQTLERLRGWAAHEAIAAACYLFARHHNDARAAILEAANTPGDSDSLATLVGALVGAHLGEGALPAEWRRDVERSGALRALALRI